MIQCSRCKKAPRGTHTSYCRTCWNTYQSLYRKNRYKTDYAYRLKTKAKIRERLYGVTEERYTELWAQQGGVCAICLLEPEDRELAVDHHHDSGQVRGLLCTNCNTGLGMFQESPRLLRRAANYPDFDN